MRRMISAKPVGAGVLAAVFCLAGAMLPAMSPVISPAAAQDVTPRGHPRIEVNPRAPVYRRCTAWYVVQHRPSGTVLFPEKHCWWQRG
jgi:hypothetical protein